MDESKLNEVSRRIAALLLAAQPDWRPYAKNDPDFEDCLLVQVPAPGGRGLDLTICTNPSGNVVVVFARWHAQFGWADQTPQETFDEASNLVEAILAEEVAGAVTMDGEVWKQSRILPTEHIGALTSTDASYVRSWLGTFDRDLR